MLCLEVMAKVALEHTEHPGGLEGMLGTITDFNFAKRPLVSGHAPCSGILNLRIPSGLPLAEL